MRKIPKSSEPLGQVHVQSCFPGASRIELRTVRANDRQNILLRCGVTGSAFRACRQRELERFFSLQFERTVNRDNTMSFQNLALRLNRCVGERRWLAARSSYASIWMERSASAMGSIAWGATRPRAGLGPAANDNRLWIRCTVEKSHTGLFYCAWKPRTPRAVPTSPQPRRLIYLNRTFNCYEQWI